MTLWLGLRTHLEELFERGRPHRGNSPRWGLPVFLTPVTAETRVRIPLGPHTSLDFGHFELAGEVAASYQSLRGLGAADSRRLVARVTPWGHHGDFVVLFAPKFRSPGGRDANLRFPPLRCRRLGVGVFEPFSQQNHPSPLCCECESRRPLGVPPEGRRRRTSNSAGIRLVFSRNSADFGWRFR
jgi:hypothetical protein